MKDTDRRVPLRWESRVDSVALEGSQIAVGYDLERMRFESVEQAHPRRPFQSQLNEEREVQDGGSSGSLGQQHSLE